VSMVVEIISSKVRNFRRSLIGQFEFPASFEVRVVIRA
jgi:hypothetical protein